MGVRLADIRDFPAMDRYIHDCDKSNLYHDRRWGNVVSESFGHRYYVLVSENADGRMTGILPFVHMRSWCFGNFLVSMPFFNYGGVCAEDVDTRDRLISETVHIAKELDVHHVEFRQESSFGNGFPEKTSKVSMRLELPGSPDELWRTFPSKLRSQIKVPQKAAMTVRIGRFDELDAFYEVFSRNMRNLGTPVYPKMFFGNILGQFQESTWICTVYSGDLAVASGFLAGFRDHMEIPWASSLRKYNRQSPNMLLYWSCLKFACERGYKLFDFGRSTRDENTYKFKEQWGATPFPMVWSYWVKEGENVPDITPRNRKYQMAIDFWKKLPVPVTRMIGPRIVRNIP